MTSGGARINPGPRPQENSLRSDRRGYRLAVLPAEGYAGPVPGFPLLDPTEREVEVWAQVWALPQGALWSRPTHAWLLLTIGLYVRQVVKCESPEAGAAQIAQLHRFADQVGMSQAGLAAHGFKVEATPVKVKSGKSKTFPTSRDRIRVLQGGGAS